MDMETFTIVRNISILSVILPLIFFILALRKPQQPATVKLLGALIFASGLSDFICLILYKYFRINSNPVILVYVVMQYILLSLVYRNAYTLRGFKKMTIAGIIVFVAFAVVNLFFVQGMERLNSNAFSISSGVLMFYCLVYFYQLFQELPEPYIERMFMFWVSAAVFIYFGTNLFLFATVDRLIDKNDNQFLLSWALHNGSNAFKNVVFAIAMYIAGRK
ncbi:MAG TPA: hypothetical protein VIN08_10980 [Ohtaekwangia sp.]|uniref:hypothetical protein n=1 Tax=Ohtaekwangia sp. TaxID=2066019 RepID=UPI002F936AC4